MPASRGIGPLLTWVAFVINGAAFMEAAETPAAASPVPPLTNAATVRGLTPEAAAQRLPVRLQGVVTCIFNPRSCFVQDQSAGIYVGNGVEVPALAAGDTVLIEGVSDPG